MDTVAQLTEIRDRLTAIIDAMKPPMTGGMDAAPNPGSGTPQGSNPTMGPIPPLAPAGNPAFPGSPVDGTAGNPTSPNPIAAILAPIFPAAMPAPPAAVVPPPPPPPPAAAQAPAQPFSVGGPESGNPTSYGQGRRGTYRRKLSRKRTAKK